MQIKQKPRIWLTLIAILIALLMCIPLAVTSLVHADEFNGSEQVIPGYSNSPYTDGTCLMSATDYGARVTLVYADTGNRALSKKSIDFSAVKNINGRPLNEANHFGKYCKSDYMNDPTLIGYLGNYEYVYAPDIKALDDNGNAKKFHYKNSGTATEFFPRTLAFSSNFLTRPDEIKEYFTNDHVLNELASQWSMSRTELGSGKYTIMIEPLAYFSFPDRGNAIYAATVTETVLWQDLNGFISKNFTRNNYGNLWPGSMVLEEPMFGRYKAKPFTASGGVYSHDDRLYHMGLNTVSWDAPSTPTTIKVYYHLYNSSDVQTSLKTSTFDLGTSTTKQFTPSTAYGTPVAACVETEYPTTNHYTAEQYRVREVGNPDKTDKLTATLTVTSSDVSNNYTIHVKVIDTVPPPATVKVPVYYYYYDGYGNQTSCSSSVESYVELNKTYTPPTKSGYTAKV